MIYALSLSWRSLSGSTLSDLVRHKAAMIPEAPLCCRLRSDRGKELNVQCNGSHNLQQQKERGTLISKLQTFHCEINSDHPHPPYWQKICPENMPYNGGLYGIKVG